MGIDLDIEGQLPDFRAMMQAYPHLCARVLGYIKHKAIQHIIKQHLEGQDLTFHTGGTSSNGTPLSKGAPLRSFGKANRGGQHMLGAHILKNLRGVSIYSKPLRVWESRKHIYSRSKSEIGAQLGAWGEEALKKAISQETGFEDWNP